MIGTVTKCKAKIIHAYFLLKKNNYSLLNNFFVGGKGPNVIKCYWFVRT